MQLAYRLFFSLTILANKLLLFPQGFVLLRKWATGSEGGWGGCILCLTAQLVFGAHDTVEQQRGLGVMLDEPTCQCSDGYQWWGHVMLSSGTRH